MSFFDHSKISLEKLAPNWDPTDKQSAIDKLQESKREGQILTGLLFIDPQSKDLHQILDTVDTPLNKLNKDDLRLDDSVLEKINQSMR